MSSIERRGAPAVAVAALCAAALLLNPWTVAWLFASGGSLSRRGLAAVLLLDLALVACAASLARDPEALLRPARRLLRRRPARVAAWVAYGAIVTVLLLEVGLRAFTAWELGAHHLLYGTRFHFKHGDEERTVGQTGETARGYLKYAPYQVVRDKDQHGRTFTARINNHGFRGRDFDLRKRAGTSRVVTLGSSSTFGYHDRDDETYPFLLERALDAQRPGAFEVLNMGIPHNTSRQIVALFEEEVLPAEPDVVTFYEGVNDTVVYQAPWLARLEARLLLARYLTSLGFGAETFDRAEAEAHARRVAAAFYAHLSRLASACAERGIRFVVVSQQAKSLAIPREEIEGIGYEDEYRLLAAKLERGRLGQFELAFVIHHHLMERLPAWAAASGVEYVDGIAALDRDRHELTSWVHLTPRANRILAAAIARTILAPGPPRGRTRGGPIAAGAP